MKKNVKPIIDVKIMATPKRTKYLENMLKKLNMSEDIIIFDDRKDGGGALYNARRCWNYPVKEGVTHRLVLQDDLLLCEDFIQTLTKAIENFPYAMWSLYSSRVTFEDVEDKTTPYLQKKGCGFHGQAICMPISYIKPCFDYIDNTFPKDYPHDDCAIGSFAKHYDMQVMTTVPSLVQHIAPNDSALGYNNKNKISKVWQGENVSHINWDTDTFSVTKRIISNNTYLKKEKK